MDRIHCTKKKVFLSFSLGSRQKLNLCFIVFAVDKNLICQKPIVSVMRGREVAAAWGPQDFLSLPLSLSFFLVCSFFSW
jgi:hypothetical protein